MRYAAEFGLTPSARARLAIDPGRGKKSKFEGLIGGKTKK
jgi:phage terminase small subunit